MGHVWAMCGSYWSYCHGSCMGQPWVNRGSNGSYMGHTGHAQVIQVEHGSCMVNHGSYIYHIGHIVWGNSTAVKTPAYGVTGQKYESYMRQSRKIRFALKPSASFLTDVAEVTFEKTILSTIYDGEEDTFKKGS